MKFSKIFILTLLTISLLSSFQGLKKLTATSDAQSKIAIEFNEKPTSDTEKEDFKFNNIIAGEISPIIYALKENNPSNHNNGKEFFLSVPTSPPNT